jgi:hypothetical protein
VPDPKKNDLSSKGHLIKKLFIAVFGNVYIKMNISQGCVVKWSVHLLERFLKILSRSLGAIPYRPGAGGKQNIGQDPESNQYLLTLFIFY